MLPTYNGLTIPNFPNYFLGALIGSSCDSLSSSLNDLSGKENQKKLPAVFPKNVKEIDVCDYEATRQVKRLPFTYKQFIETIFLPGYDYNKNVKLTEE